MNLQSGREVCPKCKRKGLGYASHAHALGWNDYEKASCRYCHATFKIRHDVKPQEAPPRQEDK